MGARVCSPDQTHTTIWKQPFTWETDFYTPPVLGGAALLPFSAPAVYKNHRVLRAQDFYTTLALKMAKGQHLPALEVYKNQSPITDQRKTPQIFTTNVTWPQWGPFFCTSVTAIYSH